VNKTAASAAQSAKCILLLAYSRTTLVSSCARANNNLIQFLTNWHNSFLIIN